GVRSSTSTTCRARSTSRARSRSSWTTRASASFPSPPIAPSTPPSSSASGESGGFDPRLQGVEAPLQRRQLVLLAAEPFAFGAHEAAVGGQSLLRALLALLELLVEGELEAAREHAPQVGDLAAEVGVRVPPPRREEGEARGPEERRRDDAAAAEERGVRRREDEDGEAHAGQGEDHGAGGGAPREGREATRVPGVVVGVEGALGLAPHVFHEPRQIEL